MIGHGMGKQSGSQGIATGAAQALAVCFLFPGFDRVFPGHGSLGPAGGRVTAETGMPFGGMWGGPKLAGEICVPHAATGKGAGAGGGGKSRGLPRLFWGRVPMQPLPNTGVGTQGPAGP